VSFSIAARRHCAAATLLLAIAVLASVVPGRASAAAPAHTDVMFVFDTTGSMSSALSEAKAEIQEAMAQIGTSLPDVQFGLSEVSDYSSVNFNGYPEGSEFEFGEDLYDIGNGSQPWTLDVPITPNQSAISAGLLNLFATGGGDGPEAYGRALYETDSNPAVGWRPGARGVIVVVADNVPHDTDLNDGIPSSDWYVSPFNTGPDPGPDSTIGTSDDIDWQSLLQKLILDGRPLEFVDYHGFEAYFPYWQNWAGRTGGSALYSDGGKSLASQLVELVKAGASAALPPCPVGQVRDSNEHCAPPPPPPNTFTVEPRISCSKGCHVVFVKITFDSAGNVVAESVLEEEAGSSTVAESSKAKKGHKKTKPLIKRLSQLVVAGPNTLKLKLTPTALKSLKKKGKLNLKVRIDFTPTGGALKSETQTFKVKLPPKHGKKHGSKKEHGPKK